MIGRLLVDYQYDGFIFFMSLQDSVNPVLSVQFVEHRSSMSLWFDRGW